MRAISDNGKTVLLASHNLGFMARLCGRSILMDQGRMIAMDETQKIVETYLLRDVTCEAENRRPPAPEKPMHLRRIALMDADETVRNHFRYDQEIKVLIDYEVNIPVKNCSVWFGIRRFDEVWVLNTADCDTNAEKLELRRPGYYSSSVTIPAKLLNAGQYYIVAGIANNVLRQSHDRVEAVAFTIVNIGVPSLTQTSEFRAGIIQLALPWDLGKTSYSHQMV